MTVSFDLWLLLPVLAPVGGLILVLLLDAIAPREQWVARPVGLASLLAGAAGAAPILLRATDEPALTLCGPASVGGACLYAAGPTTATLQIGILLAALAALLLGGDRSAPIGVDPSTVGLRGGPAVEVVLVLAVAAGGAGVVAARDVGSWLVLLELATVPAIALVALHLHRRTPGAALTLLTTSVVSFALLALGVALWVVATGSPVFSPFIVEVAAADPLRRPVLILAAVALLSGLAFKLSLVPFRDAARHGLQDRRRWGPPDGPVAVRSAVRHGGRAPCPRGGAGGLGSAVDAARHRYCPAGRRCRAAARLLDDRSGGVGRPPARGPVRRRSPGRRRIHAHVCRGEPGGRPLTACTGLLRTRPLIGGPLALALFVLAGLPPGIIGLVAKIEALRPVVEAGFWPIAVVAAMAVVLGIAVYVRWFALLLQAAPHEREGEDLDETASRIGRGSLTIIVVGTVVLVATSVVPQLLWGLLR